MFPCFLETNNIDAVETQGLSRIQKRLIQWHAENIGAALQIGPKLTVLNPTAASVEDSVSFASRAEARGLYRGEL